MGNGHRTKYLIQVTDNELYNLRNSNPMKKSFPLFLILIFCVSCSVLQNPEKIDNSIPIIANQTDIINGVYFNHPYVYTYDYKTFSDILGINDHNVDSIGIALLDAKHLEVTSYKPMGISTEIIKGKLKNGTFQIKNKNFFFGIPFLFFFNSEDKIRISVGVLDEIIVQHYHYGYSALFGYESEEEITDYYHYSKTLEVIP